MSGVTSRRLGRSLLIALSVSLAGLASAHTVFLGSVTVSGTPGPTACAGEPLEPTHSCASGLTSPTSVHPWHGPVVIDTGTTEYTYVGNVAVVPHHLQGEECSDGGQCLRRCTSNAQCGTGTCNTITGYCDDSVGGYCVEGRCCDQACDGGCGTCAAAGSLGTCVAKAAGATCRERIVDGVTHQPSACDPQAETCPGAGGSGDPLKCPADTFAGSNVMCRAAAGDCDVTEYCSGSAAACPADQRAPGSKMCRAPASACDKPEYCSGGVACGADQVYAATDNHACRDSTGPCDPGERCQGAADCPADSLLPAGTVCRAAAGACDVDDRCTGDSGACPDQLMPTQTACGPSASCTGTSATCPGSGFTTCQ